ncbi:hypothetical protein ACVJMZ_004250 [Sinorhizobium medicae]
MPQYEFVALPVRQSFDADFAFLCLQRLRSRAVERHEGGIVRTILEKRLGELHAGTGTGAVCIHCMAGHAEALPRPEIEIGSFDRLRLHEFEACLVGLERRAVILQPVKRESQSGERIRAHFCRPCQLVAVECREGRLARHVRAGELVCGLSRFQP